MVIYSSYTPHPVSNARAGSCLAANFIHLEAALRSLVEGMAAVLGDWWAWLPQSKSRKAMMNASSQSSRQPPFPKQPGRTSPLFTPVHFPPTSQAHGHTWLACRGAGMSVLVHRFGFLGFHRPSQSQCPNILDVPCRRCQVDAVFQNPYINGVRGRFGDGEQGGHLMEQLLPLSDSRQTNPDYGPQSNAGTHSS